MSTGMVTDINASILREAVKTRLKSIVSAWKDLDLNLKVRWVGVRMSSVP